MNLQKVNLEEVILHIGLHKTGSTSIQQTLFLDKNNKILEKLNYMYPKSWDSNHSIPIYSVFCDHPEKFHVNIKYGYKKDQLEELNLGYLNSLISEIAERKCSKLIISGEEISVLSHNNLHALNEFFSSISNKNVTFKIIVYVREPVAWSVSAIQEIIKGGGHYEEALKEMMKAIKILPMNHIDKFVEVFGRESMYVFPFEQAVSHQYGLVGHFLSLLGLEINHIKKFEMIRANEGVSLVSVDILSHINKRMPLIKDGILNTDRFDGDYVPLFKIRGPRFDIPLLDKIKLQEVEKQGVEWLKENFNVDYSTVDMSQINNANIDFTEETILDIKDAFLKISYSLRGLVIDYLQKKYESSTDNSKKYLRLLLDDLGNNYMGEIRLLNTLGIRKNIDPAEIYREIALFMEFHDQIESAKKMMEKALELRPNGPFIKEKCNEYNKRLKRKKAYFFWK